MPKITKRNKTNFKEISAIDITMFNHKGNTYISLRTSESSAYEIELSPAEAIFIFDKLLAHLYPPTKYEGDKIYNENNT